MTNTDFLDVLWRRQGAASASGHLANRGSLLMVAVLAPAAITATPSRLQQCDRRRRQHRAQHRQRVESLRGALGDDGKQLEVSTARRHLLPHPADLLAPAERRCIADHEHRPSSKHPTSHWPAPPERAQGRPSGPLGRCSPHSTPGPKSGARGGVPAAVVHHRRPLRAGQRLPGGCCHRQSTMTPARPAPSPSEGHPPPYLHAAETFQGLCAR